jgi:hypothetical protein
MGNRSAKSSKLPKNAYDALYDKHERLLKSIPLSPVNSKISDQAVDDYVAKMLHDPNLNLKYIPTELESIVYKNVIKLGLHAIAKVSDDSSIQLFNHRIKISVVPLDT